MAFPSIAEAHAYLAEVQVRNPGPWVAHSTVAARSASAIAQHYPGLDPQRAYVLGLLHDVGRCCGGPGVADVRHILDGYGLMSERGYDDCARICITHSFPIKDADAFASAWDSVDDRRFVQDYLDRVEYTAYDRLIQLCDSLSLPSGPCLVEKRLVDVALRHGFNAQSSSCAWPIARQRPPLRRVSSRRWRAYRACPRKVHSFPIGTSRASRPRYHGAARKCAADPTFGPAA